MTSSVHDSPRIVVDAADAGPSGGGEPSDDTYHLHDPSVVGECDVCVLEDQRLFYIQ